VTVPEQTLKSRYETDASEQERVAAFEGYLELRTDPRDLRQALETALYLPSAAIHREAARRLEELREIERTDALALQGDP
jgi:predicted outer membrane protein